MCEICGDIVHESGGFTNKGEKIVFLVKELGGCVWLKKEKEVKLFKWW